MYSGSDWLKKSLKIEDMSELGEKAADFLGDVFLGLYHLPNRSLRRVKWDGDNEGIEITLYGPLCTYDDNVLTRMIVLAHDRLLRLEISGCGPNYIKLLIHQRTLRTGGRQFERMPTLEDHVAMIRKHYGGEV